jgi:hypothetical protein
VNKLSTMLAGAHRDAPAFAPDFAPAGPASIAGAEDGADGGAGVGLAHALPYAAAGSACRLLSAATDCRAAAAARPDGE